MVKINVEEEIIARKKQWQYQPQPNTSARSNRRESVPPAVLEKELAEFNARKRGRLYKELQVLPALCIIEVGG